MSAATAGTMPVERQVTTPSNAMVHAELSALLNQRLADGIDLLLQLKQAWWNVKDPATSTLPRLFDQIHVSVAGDVELLAERIVALGGIAEGTVRIVAERSRLADYPLGLCRPSYHVDAATRALATFAQAVRRSGSAAAALDDVDTRDLLVEMSQGLYRWLWFLIAQLQMGSTGKRTAG